MPFWSKDEKTRIDASIASICTLCPQLERATIKNFLDKYVAANYGGSAMQKVLSSSLSTKGHAGVGDEALRASRRALVLLNDLLNAANPLRLAAPAVMALPAPQVTQRLTALLLPLRIYALQQENVRTLLQSELNKLIAQPATFLQNNMVVCQSYGAPPGGDRDHLFFYNFKDQSFVIWPSAWTPPAYLNGAGLTIRAVNVPEVYWANVPNRGTTASGPGAGNFAGIVATPLTGADIMVTSAFTGCSFCFKNNAGNVFAAHVSPATPNDPSIGAPPLLAMQLAGPQGTGNFASPAGATAGALQVWGRGYSNIGGHANGYTVNAVPGAPLVNASMYVIGVRNNGTWRIYSQENQGAAKTITQLL